MTTQRPKRFYKAVSVAPVEQGWDVYLDGRAIRTPAREPLRVPTRALAEAIAAEWDGQGETIDLPAMTLTRLANVAIDRTPDQRAAMADEIARYAETDVTCYLAEGPAPLRERQAAWAEWRTWAGRTLGVVLVPVEGIVAAPQPDASLDAVRTLALEASDFHLTGLAWGTSLLGSAIFAFAVAKGALDAEAALRLSCIDEDWQVEQWGADEEAAIARTAREKDACALATWFTALP